MTIILLMAKVIGSKMDINKSIADGRTTSHFSMTVVESEFEPRWYKMIMKHCQSNLTI